MKRAIVIFIVVVKFVESAFIIVVVAIVMVVLALEYFRFQWEFIDSKFKDSC